jgi:competence protein ComEC
VVAIGHFFASAPRATLAWPSAPETALALSYLGIVFACLWRGPLRWIGAPLAAAVALWPRPAPPVAWIAADGDDAAIVVAGQEVAMKPGARAYATELWAQRRGFVMASDPATAQQAHFDCDRKGCAPIGPGRPAIAAWWGKRPPSLERWNALCDRTDIVIYRASSAPSPYCGGALVLTRADFARGGSAEVFRGPRGFRIEWAQPLRGQRPWSINPAG